MYKIDEIRKIGLRKKDLPIGLQSAVRNFINSNLKFHKGFWFTKRYSISYSMERIDAKTIHISTETVKGVARIDYYVDVRYPKTAYYDI